MGVHQKLTWFCEAKVKAMGASEYALAPIRGTWRTSVEAARANILQNFENQIKY